MDATNQHLQHLLTHRWLLIRNISTPVVAINVTQAIAERYSARTFREPPVLTAPATEIMSVFGEDLTHPSATGPVFRALHFAGGMPLATPRVHTSVVRLTSLYCPKNTTTPIGLIRVVPIESLLPVGGSARNARLASLLLQRDALADGTPGNRRICLAQLLAGVAADDRNELNNDDPARIFGDDQLGAQTLMALERAYFSGYGVNIAEHELHLTLNGGDLLIIDNLRCASGYLGTPPKSTWLECLIGSNRVPTTDVSAIRAWWSSRLGFLMDHESNWTPRRALSLS